MYIFTPISVIDEGLHFFLSHSKTHTLRYVPDLGLFGSYLPLTTVVVTNTSTCLLLLLLLIN